MFRNITKMLRVNRFVRYFVLSDIILFSGWGLVSPIFSVYVTQQIVGASLFTVGIGAFVYWFVRSILQLPIADYLDNTKGEKDDFYALILGLSLMSFSAFSFVFIREPYQLYIVQAIHGLASGMYHSAWAGMFSRHLDKDRAASSWALDSALLGFAAGLTGLLGGFFGDLFGFTVVFVGAGILSFAAAFLIFIVPDVIFLPKPANPAKPEEHLPRPSP